MPQIAGEGIPEILQIGNELLEGPFIFRPQFLPHRVSAKIDRALVPAGKRQAEKSQDYFLCVRRSERPDEVRSHRHNGSDRGAGAVEEKLRLAPRHEP